MGLRPNRCAAAAALTLAVALSACLSGCANSDTFDANERWFSKPLNFVSRNGGYTYSELKEANSAKPITANDLVDAHGACPQLPATPAAPSAAGAAAGPGSDALLGQGLALGMSECEVVYRAGAPASVRLGNNPNGDRTAVLTYSGGSRAGIYRFERGRLMGMDQVAGAEPSPAPKVVKRKKKSVAEGREQVSTQ